LLSLRSARTDPADRRLTFCAWMALITSDRRQFKLSSRWVSNQMRIE